MSDDQVEYETEPSYIDGVTGKPVYYTKDVPLQIRRSGDDLDEDDGGTFAREMEELAPLQRLERGAEDWNKWLRINIDRWLRKNVTVDAIYWRWKSKSEIDGNFQSIDFSQGQTKGDEVTYEVASIHAFGAVFPCAVIFDNATFKFGAEFINTYFRGEVCFLSVTFAGVSNFSGAVFDSAVLFDGSTFREHASFAGAKFTHNTSFEKVTFIHSVNFSNAFFNRHARFEFAKFIDDTLFIETNFSGEVWFYFAKFAGRTVFIGSTFKREFVCRSAIFVATAEFDDCQFYSSADFDHVWFGKADATPLADDNWQDNEIRIAFGAITVTSESHTIPDFRSTRFDITPNLGFTHVVAIPAPTAPNGWIAVKRFWGFGLNADDSKIADENAGSKLRRLQELAAQGHHHLAEKRFFRVELLSRRGHEAQKWQEIAMINAFELFSKCGLSFQRPIWWLMGVIALSALFYAWQINWFLVEGRGAFELASYSFANSLPLLGYISDSYNVSVNVLFGGIDKVPGWVRGWAFMQNAVSAVFIFFGLLAIRNYFKLG